MLPIGKVCQCLLASNRVSRAVTAFTASGYATAPQGKGKVLPQKQILMKLRKDTGYPLAKCKRALLETNYNTEKALERLKNEAAKEGWSKMENLAGRKANQGLVTAYRLGSIAVMLEINCESDFVAKTNDFQSFVAKVARTVLDYHSTLTKEQLNLATEEILKYPVPSKGYTVQDALVKVIGKVKENVQITKAVVTSVNDTSKEFIGIYTHPDLDTPHKGGTLPQMGRYAAIVGMKTKALEPQGPSWLLAKARDLAQHVVGMNPVTVGSSDPSGTQKATVAATSEQRMDENSAEEEYAEELDLMRYSLDSDELLQQSFLLDPNITVQNWLDINQLGVMYFVRYQLGSTE